MRKFEPYMAVVFTAAGVLFVSPLVAISAGDEYTNNVIAFIFYRPNSCFFFESNSSCVIIPF